MVAIPKSVVAVNFPDIRSDSSEIAGTSRSVSLDFFMRKVALKISSRKGVCET